MNDCVPPYRLPDRPLINELFRWPDERPLRWPARLSLSSSFDRALFATAFWMLANCWLSVLFAPLVENSDPLSWGLPVELASAARRARYRSGPERGVTLVRLVIDDIGNN